jgi:hypothetical protein
MSRAMYADSTSREECYTSFVLVDRTQPGNLTDLMVTPEKIKKNFIH